MANVPITSDAVIREELMAADEVQLSWNADSGEELPAGAYIEINDERYSILEPYRPEWINEAFYKYSPVFHSRIMYWQRMPIPVYTYEEDGATIKSREFDWEFLGAPEDAVFIAAQAIFNETGERWDYEVAEGLKETVSVKAQSASIWSVLSDVAEQCETEWWVDKVNNVIHLSRCERYSELPLEVGVHVSVPNVTNNRDGYYTRFYALGSTKNITQETGTGAVAQLVNKRLTLDPKKYPQGYKDIRGHFENGAYVSDLQQGEIFAKTLLFEDVFPSSRLQISSVRKRMKYRTDDSGEKIVLSNGSYEKYAIWYFRLDGLEFTEDLIIEGKALSVSFKNGKLAGREFELIYHKEADKEQFKEDVDYFAVEAGDYEIVIDESEGVILPMVDYIIPEVGNEVVLFNINMPPEYTQSAYIELEDELDKEIAKMVQDNNNYEYESYPTIFRDNGLGVELGRRVLLTQNGQTLSSRVLMVEKRLDCEYQQTFRIGNQKISGTRTEMREEIRNVSEEVNAMDKTQRISLSLQRNYAQGLRNTASNYYALKDTIELLQGAFEGFSKGINPVSVEAMLLMLGDNSLQYRIFNDINSLVPLTNPVTYDSSTKHLHVAKSGIVHYTLGVNDIQPSSSRDLSAYYKWEMDEFTSGELIEPESRYYLYAKVSKTEQEGEYELSPALRDLDGAADYNLLVGILNAEYNGTRSFVSLYGYTAITGGQISTEVIKSSDGQTYFDLVAGVISGDIRFKSSEGAIKSISDFADEQSAQFSAVDKNVKNLQDQIDGVVENHFYEGTPTPSNYPASSWTTDIQKINHIGDTYTDIEDFVDSETTPNAGKSWRWCRCEDFLTTDAVKATDADGNVYYLHWHPIADTDAVKALLRVYELEKKVDDAEYLKKTFAKGETNISGGVVMTEMVAVGEGGEDIEAFLNGSDEFSDADHGKLILAGGIPEGTKDIKERAKEAKTKLYEDGRFETTEGKMELMQVNSMRSMVSQIDGMLYLDGDVPWYIEEFERYNGQPNSPDDIVLGGNRANPSEKIISAAFALSWQQEPDLAWDYTQIGRRRTFVHHKGAEGFENAWCTLKTPDYNTRPNDTSGLYPPYFYVDGTPQKYLDVYANDCIELYGYGYPTKEDRSAGVFMGWIVTNRTPIFGGVNQYHFSGMQEGLRPKTIKQPDGNYYLNELDHTIISVFSSGNRWLYLPQNPEDGQYYRIVKFGSHLLHIDSQDDRKVTLIGVSVAVGHAFENSFVGTIEVTYSQSIGGWIMTATRSYTG